MILAAGLGTRLRPFTDSHPKALLPLAGKTLLEWQIEMLSKAGIRDIVINVHHFADQIEAYLKEKDNFGCRIRLSEEREQLLETGGGLRHAASLLLDGTNEPILVCNVDVLSNIDLRAVCEAYREEDLAMLVVSQRETQRYLVWNEEGRLVGWRNIATGEVRQSGEGKLLAFSGMHVVSPRMLELMQPYPERFGITDFYLDQCASHTIRAYVPADYRMMDVGKAEQLCQAEQFALAL